jgi:hypothetical protein
LLLQYARFGVYCDSFSNVTQAIADPGFNINTNNIGPGVQGRKIEDLQYGAVDVVGRAQQAERGGIVEPVERVARDQALDVNSLLSSASQGQGAAGSSVDGQRAGEGIDAAAIINGLTGAQQGDGNNVNGAAVLNQGQGQGGAGVLGGGQPGGQGIDASALINGLTGAQQSKNNSSNATIASNQAQNIGQGAAGTLGSGQQGGQGIDANAIINGLAGAQQGSAGNANAATPGQGQASADLGTLLAEQNQKQNGIDGIDASALLNGLGQNQGQGQDGNRQAANGSGAGDANSIINDLLNGASGQSNVPGIAEILDGLNGQKQGQGNGQGNGAAIVEINETIVQQINGAGAITETIIQSAGRAEQTAAATASNGTVSRLYGVSSEYVLTPNRL